MLNLHKVFLVMLVSFVRTVVCYVSFYSHIMLMNIHSKIIGNKDNVNLDTLLQQEIDKFIKKAKKDE